jgi:hypothetical protein
MPFQPEDFLTLRNATAAATALAPMVETKIESAPPAQPTLPAIIAPSAPRGEVSADAAHATRLELAAEILHRFGEVRFVALGGSMVPSIYPGDLLTVRSESIADARRGEIVLFLLGGRPYVHRIVRKWPERHRLAFATRGDSLPKEDPSVDASQLLGRVTAIERRGKSVAIITAPGRVTRAMRWAARNYPMFTRFLLSVHNLRTRIAATSAPSNEIAVRESVVREAATLATNLADSAPDRLQEFA